MRHARDQRWNQGQRRSLTGYLNEGEILELQQTSLLLRILYSLSLSRLSWILL